MNSESEIESILDEIIEHIIITDISPVGTHANQHSVYIDEELIDISLIERREDDANQCIICLDNSGAKVKNINFLKNIEKKCDCNFNIHVICFHTWIKTTPACPYCHELILINGRDPTRQYRRLRMHNISSDDSDESSEMNGVETNLSRYYVRPSMCITVSERMYTHRRCIFLFLLFFFVVLTYSDTIYF